ncbi:MAG: Stage III sporulation protein AH [Firmicutes bacterium ADurb.Bin182]|nr:MAG: Stage III sporulation protein AH [Firmicutes bacterium ADurb.Bin182]
MKDKKKTWLAIIALVLLLIAAIYVNYRLNASNEENEPTAAGKDNDEIRITSAGTETVSGAGTEYFSAFREERENRRSTEFELLDAIITSENSDKQTVADAQAKKLELIACIEKEFIIESLLKAKGFRDAAVTFHAGSANVIVDSETLTEEQVAQILEIVLRETGEKAENVKIAPKK